MNTPQQMQRQWIEKEKTPILVAGDSVNYGNGIKIMTFWTTGY